MGETLSSQEQKRVAFFAATDARVQELGTKFEASISSARDVSERLFSATDGNASVVSDSLIEELYKVSGKLGRGSN